MSNLDVPEEPVPDAAAARACNHRAVEQDYARLREESYGPAGVRRILGVSRERVQQLTEGGGLAAVSGGERRGALYPAWQFSVNGADSGEIRDGVREIIEAAREADMSGYVLHSWIVEPKDRLGGRSPAELLAEGDEEPLEAVRAVRAVKSLLAASGHEGF